MGSSMVTLYIEIFSTMVHAPTHVLSGMLPEVSNPLFIRKFFDKLIVVNRHFYKSLRFNITKTWRTTDKSKFNGPKKHLKAQKSTVSNNVPMPTSHELNLEEEFSSHGLNLEEELNPHGY
jgi:hypothetical protein